MLEECMGDWISADSGLPNLVTALGVAIYDLEPELSHELRLASDDYRSGLLNQTGLLGTYQEANAELGRTHGICWSTSEDGQQAGLYPL